MKLRGLLRVFCLLWVLVRLGVAAAPAAEPPALPALAPHPRLIATQADWAALAGRRAADARLDAYVRALVGLARQQAAKPAPRREMTGRRLLFVSREVLQRVVLCAFAHRVTGEAVFLEAARRDLLAASAFSDWNPSHFLDTAEMATALALGYDWLHEALSAEERAALRAALSEKALRLAENGHHTLRLPNNWAQVCGAGLALAALAVGEEQPELAAKVLAQVRAGLSRPLSVYAPDGAYPEGPSYWTYGTLFHVTLAAALRSALGEDWGILASPGFLRSAEYEAHCTGPGGLWFNYADSMERDGINEPLCFMARELGQAGLAWTSREAIDSFLEGGGAAPDRLGPLLVFWWPFTPQAEPTAEPARFFAAQGGNPVAMWRSAWGEARARYFAIKAGGAGVSHGHMDGGSFVLDWRGQRWAADLGMQDYNALEQRGIKLWEMGQASERWQIFRLGAEAHNTLTVEGEAHSAKGMARLLRANEGGAELDLSAVLFLEPGQALRTVLVEKTRIVIEDRLEGLKPGLPLRWAMTTPAEIRTGAARVVLSQGGENLVLRFEGRDLRLGSADISAPRRDYDAANPGLSQVLVHFRADAEGRALLRTVLEAAE